ncbi:MAG TPA: glycosyltransferase, partial [Atribacterota bacterium]|nr:glycosyltransferase [Atribacterota bacterium]
STSETFGIVIIEALASGLPILAVKAPGAVDIITDGFNGILAENDIANFAEHLSVLIQDKGLRQRLSKNAQQTAKKYCIDTVADRVLELYERLIADN